jgi:CheY-like chemotaxis protein
MPKKILLVDDSNTVLMMERMILSRCGYDLITANDGIEALDRVQRDGPDLILMDVIMPRMGGLEAVQKLHGDRQTASIPVIMVTTRSEIENVEAAFENGCAEYVTKPINGLELVTKVRSFLGE